MNGSRGFRTEFKPVIEDVGGGEPDFFWGDESVVIEERKGLCSSEEDRAGTRTGAMNEMIIFARRTNDIDDVAGDVVMDHDIFDLGGDLHDFFRSHDRFEYGSGVCGVLNDLKFLDEGRVFELDAEHEAIQLTFREGVDAGLFVGILRGQDDKRFLECVGAAIDGDLSFLHGFEEGALCFGGSAVEVVGQQDVGEDRSRYEIKRSVIYAVNVGAGDVGRHEVARELNAFEATGDALGEGLCEGCFSEPRHAFDENVSASEHCSYQETERVIFTDINFADFLFQTSV